MVSLSFIVLIPKAKIKRFRKNSSAARGVLCSVPKPCGYSRPDCFSVPRRLQVPLPSTLKAEDECSFEHSSSRCNDPQGIYTNKTICLLAAKKRISQPAFPQASGRPRRFVLWTIKHLAAAFTNRTRFMQGRSRRRPLHGCRNSAVSSSSAFPSKSAYTVAITYLLSDDGAEGVDVQRMR